MKYPVSMPAKIGGAMRKNAVDEPHRKGKTAIIIPTFNTAEIVNRHLDKLQKQTTKDFDVIIIDSGESTDHNRIRAEGRPFQVIVKYFNEDLGGAGSSYEGMQYAKKMGYQNIILSDSDCIPRSVNLVEELVKNVRDDVAVVPTNCEKEVAVLDKSRTSEIKVYPFHYLTLNRRLVDKVGCIRKGLFIYGDDFDYTSRIAENAKLIKLNYVFYSHHCGYIVYLIYGLKLKYVYYTMRNSTLISSNKFSNAIKYLLINSVTGLFLYKKRDIALYEYCLIRAFAEGILGHEGKVNLPHINPAIRFEKCKKIPRNATYIALKRGERYPKNWRLVEADKIKSASLLKMLLFDKDIVINDAADDYASNRLLPFIAFKRVFIRRKGQLLRVCV
jgi:GT2 family glycosyltransferase